MVTLITAEERRRGTFSLSEDDKEFLLSRLNTLIKETKGNSLRFNLPMLWPDLPHNHVRISKYLQNYAVVIPYLAQELANANYAVAKFSDYIQVNW